MGTLAENGDAKSWVLPPGICEPDTLICVYIALLPSPQTSLDLGTRQVLAEAATAVTSLQSNLGRH